MCANSGVGVNSEVKNRHDDGYFVFAEYFVRLCPTTSCGIAQPSQHEAD